MDWLDTIGVSCLDTLTWMAGLMLVFGLLAYLMPCNRGMFWWKDLAAASAPISCTGLSCRSWAGSCARAAPGRGAGIVLRLCDVRLASRLLQCDLPLLAQQCVAQILLLQDVLLYWIHRGFHTGAGLEVFHAIHHSPTVRSTGWRRRSFHLVNYMFLCDRSSRMSSCSCSASPRSAGQWQLGAGQHHLRGNGAR